MKSVELEFMGERSAYWRLYFGWGLLIGVVLLHIGNHSFAFSMYRRFYSLPLPARYYWRQQLNS